MRTISPHSPAPAARQTILLSAINQNLSESETRFFSTSLVLKQVILGDAGFFWVSPIKPKISDRIYDNSNPRIKPSIPRRRRLCIKKIARQIVYTPPANGCPLLMVDNTEVGKPVILAVCRQVSGILVLTGKGVRGSTSRLDFGKPLPNHT